MKRIMIYLVALNHLCVSSVDILFVDVVVCIIDQVHRRDAEVAAAANEQNVQTVFDIKHTAPQHRQYLEYGVSTEMVLSSEQQPSNADKQGGSVVQWLGRWICNF